MPVNKLGISVCFDKKLLKKKKFMKKSIKKKTVSNAEKIINRIMRDENKKSSKELVTFMKNYEKRRAI